MSTLNTNPYGTALPRQSVVELISRGNPSQVVCVLGKTGSGKSALLDEVVARCRDLYPDVGYTGFFLDGLAMQEGDLTIPAVGKESGVIELQIQKHIYDNMVAKPSVVMIDEASKMPKGIKRQIGTLFRERRIGAFKVHEDTRIFSTGNLAEEGFGDAFDPTQWNRMTTVELQAMTGEEWVKSYAIPNKLHYNVIYVANELSKELSLSFRDKDAKKYNTNAERQADMPHMFDPKVPRNQFTTFRSLELASNICYDMDVLGKQTTYHALCGTVGQFTTDMIFRAITLGDKLPSLTDVETNPDDCKLAERGACATIMVHKLLNGISTENYKAIWTYLQRMDVDAQLMFVELLKGHSRDGATLFKSLGGIKSFTEWCVKNADLFRADKV